jgi:transposase InsO family protein
VIDETLKVFEIKRFLSYKGCPYDNAVVEATFKIINAEFIKNQRFVNLYELQIKLADYVNWFNNHRIHSAVEYLTPYQYRISTLKRCLVLTVDNLRFG